MGRKKMGRRKMTEISQVIVVTPSGKIEIFNFNKSNKELKEQIEKSKVLKEIGELTLTTEQAKNLEVFEETTEEVNNKLQSAKEGEKRADESILIQTKKKSPFPNIQKSFSNIDFDEADAKFQRMIDENFSNTQNTPNGQNL